MHASFTIAAVALLSSLAAAQIPGLPSCAATCVGTSFGDCGSLDVKCICSTEGLISNLSCCVSKACNEDDQMKTIEFANSLCSGQGVTNLPTAASCEGSASATSSSMGSMMSSSSMMDMSSSMSGASMSASSAMSSASSMASSMMSGASSTSSAASASASASASGSTEQSTGGAEGLRSGLAGAVGLVLAGVAAAL